MRSPFRTNPERPDAAAPERGRLGPVLIGVQNPPISWGELERRLSDRRSLPGARVTGAAADASVGTAPASVPGRRPVDGRGDPRPVGADGSDSPAWSRRRQPYQAPTRWRLGAHVPYAELHCHSNFSFLDGASHPEELVEEAARLGLEALALTDHDGFYGVVRMAEAARALSLPVVYGAELTLGLGGRNGGRTRVGRTAKTGSRTEAGVHPVPGAPDPVGTHLVVLARDPEGYARLSSAIGRAQLRGKEKGCPIYDLAELTECAAGHWLVLTGGRKGVVPRALEDEGPAAAARALGRLVDAFGRENVAVELWDHGAPLDVARNDALVHVALEAGVEPVATNGVHYAVPAQARLAGAMAAVRARCSLEELNGWLPANGLAHLRSGLEQERRFSRWPGVVERAAELGLACAFDLSLVAPKLPDFPVREGSSEMDFLRLLVDKGASERYGPRHATRVPGAWAQLDHELAVIEQLGFAGYFLVVWDIVRFCRERDIFCQGRGSAANSAVCYALGVTAADAVALGLLFERFLSPERDGPPDIDVDIESGRRDEVIAYVYDRHGRERAAQVANVITYRARAAVRDAGKALGYGQGTLDAWSKQLDWRAPLERAATIGPDGRPDHDIPAEVLELAAQLERFPRHLGIHSGGMVICDRPVLEVCPVEWGRMPGRTVLQWDKDDCAAIGLVKFDLLGLGMLTALHEMVDAVRDGFGVELDLARLPQEEAVYAMLSAGDSVGVFQVESRAQMATLPRLRPRCFYDLVVEVALIRPGPIQGGSVHPYIRRRNGVEPVTYLHPLLERSLAKTLGVPLFQEQLMQMAIDVAGFSAGEADQLRQAMGSKRSSERMDRLCARFYAGMAERGITGEVADAIWEKLAAFANFGFPESHSVSFAYLVYSSAWCKLHYPAAFLVGLLNAQPMGFWSPQTLVADARRHGVVVRRPHVNASLAKAVLEPEAAGGGSGSSGSGGRAVRLGLSAVRGLGEERSRRIAAERLGPGGPYASIEDLLRRTQLDRVAVEGLATAGALDGLPATGDLRVPVEVPGRGEPLGGVEAPAGGEAAGDESTQPGVPSWPSCREAVGARSPGRRRLAPLVPAPAPASAPAPGLRGRREALWAAGALAHGGPDRLAGIVTGAEAPALPAMSELELAASDLWATGVTPETHPVAFVRERLRAEGVRSAAELAGATPRSRVAVAGVVTHRQRPATAGGTTFLNLEDETGLVNVVVSKGAWVRWRRVARAAPALVVRGRLERAEGVTNVIAERIEPLSLAVSTGPSRDFR